MTIKNNVFTIGTSLFSLIEIKYRFREHREFSPRAGQKKGRFGQIQTNMSKKKIIIGN